MKPHIRLHYAPLSIRLDGRGRVIDLDRARWWAECHGRITHQYLQAKTALRALTVDPNRDV